MVFKNSDEESIEEKDHFVAQLFKFMDDRGTPLNQAPVINDKDVDLYKLFKVLLMVLIRQRIPLLFNLLILGSSLL